MPSNFSVSSRSAFQPTRSTSQRNNTDSHNEPRTSSRNALTSRAEGVMINETRAVLTMLGRARRISQNNFNIFWDVLHGYVNSLINNQQPTNENENAGEQSENGYWLLEENSNSDSNHEESNGGNNAATNPRRRTCRWIQLGSNRNTETSSSRPRTPVSIFIQLLH